MSEVVDGGGGAVVVRHLTRSVSHDCVLWRCILQDQDALRGGLLCPKIDPVLPCTAVDVRNDEEKDGSWRGGERRGEGGDCGREGVGVAGGMG